MNVVQLCAHRRCLVLLTILLLTSPGAFAEVTHLVRYQGQAVDSQGVPLEGTQFTLTFRLYDAATGGTVVWTEIQSPVPITGGHFSVLLGQVTPLTVDWTTPVWLSVQIGAEPELQPRQRITSVPLAIRAEVAEGLATPISTSTITDDAKKLVPAGAIILWSGGSCPAGYTRLTTLDGKFLASAATFNANAGGQDSVTAGTSTAGSHSHSISGTTSSASGTSCGWNASKGCGGSEPTDAAQLQHTHSGGSLTGSSAGDHTHSVSFDNRPAFATVLLCRKD
jgi:hypothetical protein